MTELVDTHAHLDDRRLRVDAEGVLRRAADAGVASIIAIGTTAATSQAVVLMTGAGTGAGTGASAEAGARAGTGAGAVSGTGASQRACRGIFAAVGIHPNDAAEAAAGDWSVIVELIRRPGVVAVGETGLDRYWKRTPFEQQQEWFDRHLALAHEHHLPVIIHCRDCQTDIIEQLRRLNRPLRGVMHAFTGDWEHAQAFLELGLHLSFAGMITFLNKGLDPLRGVAARVPLDRLLVETDSPYLSPHPFRGQSNEPARVALVAQRLAEIRRLPYDELARVSTANARELFQLPAHEVLSGPFSTARDVDSGTQSLPNL
jgi:TatD DNase family protein